MIMTGTVKSKQAISRAKAKHTEALLGDKLTEDVHNFRINRHDFTVYVGGDPEHPGSPDELELGEPGVDYLMANRFDMNLGILSSIDPTRPILVEVSSCGGHYEAGMQMFGAILACPNPVTVMATKWARSMTSIIPLAADRFVMRPPATYMYHHGTYGFYGLDQEAATADVERRKSRETMFRIYTARLQEQGKFSSRTAKWIRDMLDERLRQHIDVWFSADEAVAWGFADEVFEGNHETLRVKRKNILRRERMLEVLRKPIKVEVKIS